MSEFEPNAEAVRRISTHLLGEDMRNVGTAIEASPAGYMVVSKDVKELLLAAIDNAANIMDGIDPDDRAPSEERQVDAVKALIDKSHADPQIRALLIEAVPSWGE